jgi:hypothetical protein
LFFRIFASFAGKNAEEQGVPGGAKPLQTSLWANSLADVRRLVSERTARWANT